MFKILTILENSVRKNSASHQKQFSFSWKIFSIFCLISFLFCFQIINKCPISIFALNNHWKCSQDCSVKNINEKIVFVSEFSKDKLTAYIFSENLKKRKEFCFINYKDFFKAKLRRFKNDWDEYFFKLYNRRNKLYIYNPRLFEGNSLLYNFQHLDTISFQGYNAGSLLLTIKISIKHNLYFIKEYFYVINHKLRGPPEFSISKSIFTNSKYILF